MKTYRAWKKVLVEGTFTSKEWGALCAKYDNRCVCCGRQVKLVPDHIVPTSKDGTNYIDNIQPLCRECNSSKNDQTIDYRNRPFAGSVPMPPKKLRQRQQEAGLSLWLSLEPRPKLVRRDGNTYFIFNAKRHLVPDDTCN
jgi:hypothetical protein